MEKPKSQNWLNRLFAERWFQIVYGLMALFLAYVFASWAIDNGSLLDYTIAFLLLFLGVRELVAAIFKKKHAR